MSKYLLPFFAIAVLALMTLPTWAKNNPSAESIKTTIDLSSTVNFSPSTTLAPGQYQVVAEGNQAKFEQNGKIIAEVPFSWKTLPSKAQHTEVLMNRDRITEIDVSGKTQAIEFSNQS
jgi:hypothetical protein